MDQYIDLSYKYPRALLDEVALCNMSGRIVNMNTAYVKLIGREIEETKQLTYWQMTPEKYNAQEQNN